MSIIPAYFSYLIHYSHYTRTVKEIAKICWNDRHLSDIERDLKQWAEEIIDEAEKRVTVTDMWSVTSKASILDIKEEL